MATVNDANGSDARCVMQIHQHHEVDVVHAHQ